MENQKKTNILTIILSVLFFGALWGILEATLGTLLHLPFFDKFGIYGASTTIIVPLAFLLMSLCYKKTNALFSLPMMGILASIIKLSVGLVIGFRASVYNPAIYILIESLVMMSAVAVFRPKNVLSLRTLGTFILANTLYQFSYLTINYWMGGTNVFASIEAWERVGEKYLLKMNMVAILYSLLIGGLSYLVLKLLQKYNFEIKFDINKIIYSPITASILTFVAFGVTIGFAFI